MVASVRSSLLWVVGKDKSNTCLWTIPKHFWELSSHKIATEDKLKTYTLHFEVIGVTLGGSTLTTKRRLSQQRTRCSLSCCREKGGLQKGSWSGGGQITEASGSLHFGQAGCSGGHKLSLLHLWPTRALLLYNSLWESFSTIICSRGAIS